jgi:hypothetical protein
MTTAQYYLSGNNIAINVNGTKYNIRLNEYDKPIDVGTDDDGVLTIWNAQKEVLFKSTDACTFMRLPIVNE